MTQKLRIPHYFGATLKREIVELYASMAIGDFAIAVVMLFEPIFLYSVLKFTVSEVLLFMGAVYALYIILIPLGAKIVSRYGYAKGILISIPFQIIYWTLLFGSEQFFFLIYFAPIAFAIEKSLFWPAFHACVARFAHKGQQGREFSVLHQIINISFVLGPYLGGLVSEHFGVRMTFVLASALYICCFVPFLFGSKEIFLPKFYAFRDTLRLYKQHPKKFLGYLGFGEELLVLTVWPIFIYIAVSNYEEAGLIATLAGLVAMIVGLYVGKISDRPGGKSLLLKAGSIFYFVTWVGRVVANTFFSIFAIDSASRISKEIVFIPLSAVTYERAENGKIMPYVVFFEQSLAIGKLLAVILGFIIFASTGSFLAVFILAGLFSLLYMFI